MDRIAIRRGSGYPTSASLNENELGYWTAGESLFIGTSGSPVRVASAASAEGRFPCLRLLEQRADASVSAGTLYEGADGRLYYKNLSGVTSALTPAAEEEEE
ncbi:MAG: hypothetical protein IKX98_00345 [Clostridia bacterium]|nr:hypothetical protein [Clostridia bacterium]